jgi:hypothetical protein
MDASCRHPPSLAARPRPSPTILLQLPGPQVVLFHEEAAEAASEEALVELSDWCARALAYLGSGEAHEHAAHKGAQGWRGGDWEEGRGRGTSRIIDSPQPSPIEGPGHNGVPSALSCKQPVRPLSSSPCCVNPQQSAAPRSCWP